MKQLFITFIFAILPLICQAQSWNSINKSDEYISGIGNGSTVAEADRRALADLISKIATLVSSDTNMGFKEENDGQTINHQSYIENNIKTYSQATLTNTERIIIKNEPDATVGRYIKKAELNRIFESRKAKAIDMVETALRAEETGKADDALRNYYWALALIRSSSLLLA